MTQYIGLSTTAPLDTANPSTDRAPGTLTLARDLNHRYWGPRVGSTAVDHPRDHSHTPCGPGEPYESNGTGGIGVQAFTHGDQRDLGTTWTLDVAFRAIDLSHTAKTLVQIFEWRLSAALQAIEVYIKGPGSGADEGKIRVVITPTAAADSPGTSVTLDGTTALSVGVDPQDKHVVRVVRDRGTVTLYVNGVSEDSDSISALQPHQGGSELGSWGISIATSTASVDYFKGEWFWVVMRRGVHATGHSLMQPSNPVNRGVVLHLTFGDTTRMQDNSRFGRVNLNDSSTGSGVTSTRNEYPFLCPVQGVATFTDLTGRTWNALHVGGVIYFIEVA